MEQSKALISYNFIRCNLHYHLKLPFLVIASFSLSQGNSGIPISTSMFMKATGLSKRIIIKSLKELEQLGLIKSYKSLKKINRYICASKEDQEKWAGHFNKLNSNVDNLLYIKAPS